MSDGSLIEFNQAAETTLDLASDDIECRGFYDLVNVREPSPTADAVQNLTVDDEPVVYQTEFLHGVEPPQPVIITTQPITYQGKSALLSVARDLPRLRSWTGRPLEFKEAVEHSGHAIFFTDINGTIQYVNPAFEQITGYSVEEAVGLNPRILQSGEHDQAFYEDLWQTILNGDVWQSEIVNQRKDGERFVVDQTIAPICNSRGKIDRFVAVNRDITDRANYKRQLEDQRDMLDLLNQVLRHDIRNDLQVVTSYGEMVRERVDKDEQEQLEKMVEAASHATELTLTARDLSEVLFGESPEQSVVPLGDVVASELNELRSRYDQATITVEGLPDVNVRANELLQAVVRNLLTNAVRHNDKDIPQIAVSVEKRDEHARLIIADNGPGISDEQKADIFEKGVKGLESPGTGLGLYLVKTLVSKYDGEIQIDDNEPEGTVFTVGLPLAET